MRSLSLLTIVFMIFLMSSCMYGSKAQHRLYREVEHKHFDLLIVPGIPFQKGNWQRTMKGRMYWSKFLYDKGIAANVMYSGSAVSSPYYEGKIMALYAVALGIPKEHVFSEIKAEHSTENVYYSYKLGRKLGFTTMAVATDPFQSKQLRRFIQQKISDSIPVIPFVVDTLKIMEPLMIEPVIPYDEAFKKDFVPLKSRQSVWKRWRGTRGKNMDQKAYE